MSNVRLLVFSRFWTFSFQHFTVAINQSKLVVFGLNGYENVQILNKLAFEFQRSSDFERSFTVCFQLQFRLMEFSCNFLGSWAPLLWASAGGGLLGSPHDFKKLWILVLVTIISNYQNFPELFSGSRLHPELWTSRALTQLLWTLGP